MKKKKKKRRWWRMRRRRCAKLFCGGALAASPFSHGFCFHVRVFSQARRFECGFVAIVCFKNI
jgi:hypothetical protein